MSTVIETSAALSSQDAITALRAIDYDWTMHLRSVWSDPPFDSPELHHSLREEFQQRLDDLRDSTTINSPLGWLVVGAAGSGKTHWLSICRRQAVDRGISFVLVDMTGVRDFWSTLLQGYLDSLQQEYAPGKFQQQAILARFLELFKFRGGPPNSGKELTTKQALEMLPALKGDKLSKMISAVISVIRRKHPSEALQHHDVIRAVLAVASHDSSIAAAGLSWLNGNAVDDDMRVLLGFTQAQQEPRKIVQALSWMMSLCGPTVLAFDQLDPIVAELDPAAQADGREPDAQGLRALGIIQGIANGLGATRDTCYKTLTVVSCLETTIAALRRYTLASWQDRFEEARSLPALSSASAAESIIAPRVIVGFEKIQAKIPYTTWPIPSSAFTDIHGISPRELLKRCESHRRRCLQSKAVDELKTLSATTTQSEKVAPADNSFDRQFEAFRQAANIEDILKQETEDQEFAPLLISAARCLLHEISLPSHLDAVVDEFPGGKTTKPLHARVRLIDHEQNDREQHFCYRALGRDHAVAFQSRLRGVMNGSGVDQKLPFRHALVLRHKPVPTGKETDKLVTLYNGNGGTWHAPAEDEVRTLFALHCLSKEKPEGWIEWLQQRKPTSQLPLFHKLCQVLWKSENAESAAPKIEPGSSKSTETQNGHMPTREPNRAPVALVPPTETSVRMPTVTQSDQSRSPITSIPLGQRTLAGKPETQYLPLEHLEKHSVVLAGAGSGKTVLLKRIIEEAALAGIPSLVIDGANDLAALAIRRTSLPAEWGIGDADKAQQYHNGTQVVVFTPGKEAGNPLVFEPLPELAAVADNQDELTAALDMVVESIGPTLAVGSSAKAHNKRAIIRSSLKFLAQQQNVSIPAWIDLLKEFPAEAGVGIDKEARLARELADALLAGRENNPLLRGSGQGLDCAKLFGDDALSSKRTRVSVINFCGLSSRESQQLFLNQLAMTLFAWIKKHPCPPGRPLRGLMIIDEAKDFVPSRGNTACKAALARLAAQARKYHLGIIFATQNPKEIDNNIIGNCSTHFYGKASSPAGQDAIRDQMRQKGGEGTDIGNLPRGVFYFHNADLNLRQPLKLETSLCLSEHRPLEESEVLRLAAQSSAALLEA
ncbi:MAG TPA: DUF87 domain-containing protein [Pirellulaceae bacterium]|nr:DUF87 domain-containing protein [Pirellulaceae bacterium]